MVLSKLKKDFHHIANNTKLITFYGALMKDAKPENYNQLFNNHPILKSENTFKNSNDFIQYFINSDHNYQEIEMNSYVYNESLKTDGKMV